MVLRSAILVAPELVKNAILFLLSNVTPKIYFLKKMQFSGTTPELMNQKPWGESIGVLTNLSGDFDTAEFEKH